MYCTLKTLAYPLAGGNEDTLEVMMFLHNLGQSRYQSFIYSSLMYALMAKAVLCLGIIKKSNQIKSNSGSAAQEEKNRQRLEDCHSTHRPALQYLAQAGYRHPFAALPHIMNAGCHPEAYQSYTQLAARTTTIYKYVVIIWERKRH